MITVIVPALNEEKLIEKCLTTLARQSPPPEEILVVDNGSTDRTIEIVTKFMDSHPELNMKLIHEAKKGCTLARETGWRAAAGDVIVHVDADEFFPDDWLQKIRKTLAKHPEMGAFGGTIRFENPPLLIGVMQSLYNLIYPRMVRWSKGFPYICGGMTIVKREVLEKMNGYADIPANQLDDYYLASQAHRMGYKTGYFPSIYAIHSLRRYEEGGLKGWLNWGVAGLDATQYESR